METQTHKDLFRHDSAKQKEDGTIYCHNSGMDITCGNGKDVFCGVLVRGLKDETGRFYNGPLQCINKAILAQLGISGTYSKSKHEKILEGSVYLEESGIPQKTQIVLQGPRHGLGKGRFATDGQGQTQRDYFKYAPYRYIIDAQAKNHTYADKEKCIFVSAKLGKPVKDPQKAVAKAEEWVNLYRYYNKPPEFGK